MLPMSTLPRDFVSDNIEMGVIYLYQLKPLCLCVCMCNKDISTAHVI